MHAFPSHDDSHAHSIPARHIQIVCCLLLASLCLLSTACDSERQSTDSERLNLEMRTEETPKEANPDTLVMSYDADQMDGAIAKAKSEVDSFIQELEEQTGSNHSVKAPISDNGETEHFWLSDISYKNGVFYGKIGNDPGLVTNVIFGQPWEVKKEDITDWTYIKNKKM